MTGKAAFITGSSRGIGLATALELAGNGFAIALNGPILDAELSSAADRVREIGVPVCVVALDVSDIANHDRHLTGIEAEIGPLTTLVNNAGVGVVSRGDILDVSEASYDRCLTINAKAPFFLSQAFARRLVARKRDASLFHSLINVTSSNAVAVAAQRAEYCASKAAAAMTSKAFAVRLGEEDIAVYDVQPGLISTDMTAPVIEAYAKRAEDGLTLMPRVGQPEEVARLIATLATGGLPYTTGHAISVDGGMLVPRF